MTKKAPPWAPYTPVDWQLADANALRALAAGTANDDQQRRALHFIINNVCRTYDLSFCPGVDGDRETAMAEGRRFVGLQIVKLLNIDLNKVRRDNNE